MLRKAKNKRCGILALAFILSVSLLCAHSTFDAPIVAHAEAASNAAPEGSAPEGAEAADTSTPEPEATPTPEASAEPTPTATVYPSLQLGMTGDDVLALQQRLIALKYLSYPNGTQPSGTFDELTQAAVKLFQTQAQQEATGIADDATQQLLFAANAPVYAGATTSPATTPMPSMTPGGGTTPSGGWPQGGKFPSGTTSKAGAAGMTGAVGSAGATATADPGIVPGQALTSTHSSGDKDMTIYGALDAGEIGSGTELSKLTTGDEDIGIALADSSGAAQTFTAEETDGALTLTAQAAGDVKFTINGRALKCLMQSGITSLTLKAGEATYSLATGENLTGADYAALRAQGFVSQDFDYAITLPSSGAAGATVNVNGATYDLTQDLETLRLIGSTDTGATTGSD